MPPRFGRRLDRVVPAAGLALLLVFSGTLLARRAAALPFWYDEVLTVRLSEVDSVADLWKALTSGFEFTPPLNYLATRLARTLPGPETLTARLPALAGYALLTVTLFIFLRRRIGPWFALAATGLLPLAQYTISFAIEARPYMLLLGVAGCALVLWQTAGEDGRPSRASWAAAGLAVTLALALLLHVWAVLLPAAMIAGELAAAIRTRKIRWRVVLALAAAAPVLGLYPSLLGASQTVIFGGPAYAPSPDKLYGSLLNAVPRPRVLVTVLSVAVLAGWWRRSRAESDREMAPGFRAEELVVIVALLLSPLVPYGYASIASGAFMSRYAMFVLPAVACLAGAAMYYTSGRQRLAGQCAAAVTIVGVLLYFPARVPATVPALAVLETLVSARDRLDPSIPIVLVNPVDVLPFDQQAEEGLLRRTFFVADADLALQHTGTNGIDLGYVRGEPYLRLRIQRVSYEALKGGHARLYLAGKWQALSWLPQQLERDGWRMAQMNGSPQAPLFEATQPISAAFPR